ncbi:hypothetical protein AZA_48261 [Nitrospirillum viridazoti Y2]|nr:hypothetical protein AZA_48261 [Nitrospirillum amazonense Y2]
MSGRDHLHQIRRRAADGADVAGLLGRHGVYHRALGCAQHAAIDTGLVAQQRLDRRVGLDPVRVLLGDDHPVNLRENRLGELEPRLTVRRLDDVGGAGRPAVLQVRQNAVAGDGPQPTDFIPGLGGQGLHPGGDGAAHGLAIRNALQKRTHVRI